MARHKTQARDSQSLGIRGFARSAVARAGSREQPIVALAAQDVIDAFVDVLAIRAFARQMTFGKVCHHCEAGGRGLRGIRRVKGSIAALLPRQPGERALDGLLDVSPYLRRNRAG